MNFNLLRSLILSGSVCALVAACADADIVSPGQEGQVDAGVGGGSGGGSGGGGGSTVITGPACPAGTSEDATLGGETGVRTCVIGAAGVTNQIITSPITLVSGAHYEVRGTLRIGQDAGPDSGSPNAGVTPVTLTVEPGATIFGGNDDVLIISRGSRINAVGTKYNPIIMTSREDLLGNADPVADSGQWGGVVINGRAPINDCAPFPPVAGTFCEKDGEGNSGLFGGNDPLDNSGILRYVQVRYAGERFSTENELNGIAFQGVGSATDVDFIQVMNNQDDGVEFFGGTVNAKYVVLNGNEDDSLDWTDGWQGKVQFGLIQQDRNADKGFEGDNNGDFNDREPPRSAPTIGNFTMVGTVPDPDSDSSQAMRIREGTAGNFFNIAATDFADACLDVDQAETEVMLAADRLNFWALNFACTVTHKADGSVAAQIAEFDTVGQGNVGTPGGFSFVNNFFPDATLAGASAVNPNLANTLAGTIDASSDGIDDTFFTSVDYVGAFSATETPQSNWAAVWTFDIFPAPTCPGDTGTITIGNPEFGNVGETKTVCTLSGPITEDTRLFPGVFWDLNGIVTVGEDVGGDSGAPAAGAETATLTIDAGAVIIGGDNDVLTVARGSDIEVRGTEFMPVIMTSRQDVEGTADPAADSGQWGGLVINGRAPINDCAGYNPAAFPDATCQKDGEGNSGFFGGNDIADDSGSIRYLQVRYAGERFSQENELNGIAFQGVGSNTEVEYIQVMNNQDDGVEFFGGTVNAKYVVLNGNEDDSLDWTDGWTGSVQFVLIQQDRIADKGFEGDNNGDFNTRNAPRSEPTIGNVTMVGTVPDPDSDSSQAMRIREGTAGNFFNIVATDFEDACLDVDQAETEVMLGADRLNFWALNFGCTVTHKADGSVAAQITEFDTPGQENAGGLGFSLVNSFFPDAILNGRPAVNPNLANVLAGTVDASSDGINSTFFTSVDYVGAFSPTETPADNWAANWTFDIFN